MLGTEAHRGQSQMDVTLFTVLSPNILFLVSLSMVVFHIRSTRHCGDEPTGLGT